MFRGILYRSGLLRGFSAMGSGVLNVDDYKNYRSEFLLIADTGDDFLLNGEVIDGGTGHVISSPGYYEAAISDPATGEMVLSRFCFWKNVISNIEAVSVAVAVSDLQYQKQTSDAASNIVLYSLLPVVGFVYDDSGSPVLAGVVGDRNFYRDAQASSSIKMLPRRMVQIYDDPVRWQNGQAKAAGEIVCPASGLSGFYYVCTTAGTTAGTEPTWPVIAGNTVTDNGVVWECVVGDRRLHFQQKVTG